MAELNENQLDALAEFVNLGIGRAADALSDMTNEEILLDVPSVELCPRAEVPERLRTHMSGRIMTVVEPFSGPFSGDAMLCFPEESSLALVRTILEKSEGMGALTELEQDALVEVGNVLLNACLSSFADSLEIELETGLPRSSNASLEAMLSLSSTGSELGDAVLLMSIHFSLSVKNLQGYVVFVLDSEGVQSLLHQVDAYLERLGLR